MLITAPRPSQPFIPHTHKRAPEENVARENSICDVDIPFPRLDNDHQIEDEFVRLRFAGPEDEPVVFVLGGISASRIVADNADQLGWWSDVVAAGGGVDLERFRVVGADFFPLTPRAALTLTPADYADVFVAALRQAGVEKLHAAVGASFGGMVCLALARRHPEFVDRLAVICAAHRTAPLAGALRFVQREIIALAARAGDAEAGVALARQLAMTTYRTAEEFQTRFQTPTDLLGYLGARGADYARRMSPERYLTLSGAIDRHDETPEEITTPTLVVAATSDQLAPIADCRALARRLGGASELFEFPSLYGHDAFLKDAATFSPALDRFLKETF